MKLPTDAQSAAAKAWLEQWVPGYSLGQFAALAELLAGQSGEPAPARRPGTYVFAKRLRGEHELDLDGSPTELYATSLEDARERAARIGRELAADLTYVGFVNDATSATHRRFEAALPYEELPPWAQGWIDEQRESAVTKAKPRARKGTKAA